MTHLKEDEIAQYVAGMDMDDLALHNLKSHLASCEACSETLTAAASLELKLRAIAKEATYCVSCEVLAPGDRCEECGAAVSVPGFKIEKILVKNSRGRMYVARGENGDRVALKELAFVQSPSAEDVAAFERESTILRTLNHPGIPNFVAAFQVGSGVSTRFYLAQEFVEGESLEERMRNHHFSESDVVAIGERLLEILCYLQALSPMVFHRDVKPSNIIYGKDGSIVLVDFGSARSMGPTASATLVGTFGYMPVEQLGGIISASSDVYALGATMCQLLTRREPWHLLEDRDLLQRMNVSTNLRDVIAKMVAPMPEERYSGAVEALHALQEDHSAAPAPKREGFFAGIMSSLAFAPRRGVVIALAALLTLSGGVAGYTLLSGGGEAEIHEEEVTPDPTLATGPQSVTVAVVVSPMDAWVTIDGILVGQAPVQVELTAGEHQLHVRLKGYQSREKRFMVPEDHGPEVMKQVVILQRSKEPWECDEVTCLVDPELACCRAKRELEELLDERDELPERLGRMDVVRGMRKVRGDVTSCLVDNPVTGPPDKSFDAAEGSKGKPVMVYESRGSGMTVKVKMRIEPDGSVSSAKADRGTRRLRSCLERALKKAQFAKSKNGIALSYPFVLKSHPIACDPNDPLCGL